jgi:predicted DNA-binding protein (UPF0251 family)
LKTRLDSPDHTTSWPLSLAGAQPKGEPVQPPTPAGAMAGRPGRRLAVEPGPSLDPVDREKALELVRQELADEQIEALVDASRGASHEEIAADRGISAATARKQHERSRKKVAAKLVGAGIVGVAAMLAGMQMLHVGPWGEDENTAGRPPRGGDRSLEVAAEQRRVAADACEMRDWDVCGRSLDRAAVLDPEGDKAPEVKALREAITAGRRAEGSLDGGAR